MTASKAENTSATGRKRFCIRNPARLQRSCAQTTPMFLPLSNNQFSGGKNNGTTTTIPFKKWSAVGRVDESFRQSYLLHKRLVIPVEIFCNHFTVLPMSDGAQGQFECFAGCWNCFAVTNRHGLGKCSEDVACYTSPIARTESDGMLNNSCVRGKHKHGF